MKSQNQKKERDTASKLRSKQTTGDPTEAQTEKEREERHTDREVVTLEFMKFKKQPRLGETYVQVGVGEAGKQVEFGGQQGLAGGLPCACPSILAHTRLVNLDEPDLYLM
ncbi:hypothetical protein Pmani_033687 [Petrolisthes manimaculis]|uniref:Uncharacterized protein n=1 Tax=Petrolisthes manimaculis TaxID=1843537 RepID=A0AAE1TQF3_9EUCA|nr:hypothetical protein Pmani_033687 [Petrolisthes manimaculis]